jgi:hypothetical protein
MAAAPGCHHDGYHPVWHRGRAGLGPAASPAHPPRGLALDHDGPLPVIEGTLIRLQVDHLPGDRDPKPLWLWCSATGAPPAEVNRLWQAFLRRFDLEMSKPQCCHTCGLSAFSLVPSSAVLMLAC